MTAPRWRSLPFLLFCAAALGNLLLLWNAQPRIRGGASDFVHLYVAGQLIRTGQASHLQDKLNQLRVQEALSDFVRKTGEPYPFMRPSFEALVFVPLSYLPYLKALALWDALSLAMLTAVFALLRRKLPALASLSMAHWLVLVLGFFPTIALLAQGQDDAILVLLLALTFLSLREKRYFRSGIWLGLGLFRPQFSLPILLIVVCEGKLALLAGLVVVAIGLALITAVVFGWAELARYPVRLLATERFVTTGRGLLHHMPNFHGFFSYLLSAHLPGRLVFTLILLFSLAVLIAAIYGVRRTSFADLSFSCAVIAAILVSYHAFAHDLTLLLIPVLLQLNWLAIPRNFSGRAWLIIIPAAVLFTTPVCILMVRNGLFYLYSIALVLWLAGSLLALRQAEPVRAGSLAEFNAS